MDAHAAGPEHAWALALPEDGRRRVTGDEARLRQVLANLLANARTHTPAGTDVSAALAAEAATSCDVADDGPGIPADLRPTLFRRFTRGDASRRAGGQHRPRPRDRGRDRGGARRRCRR